MHCVFGAILELAQLVLYGLIGCFVSSSAFLVDSGVVVLKCGMGVDLCRYAKVLCILPRSGWRWHDVGFWNVYGGRCA